MRISDWSSDVCSSDLKTGWFYDQRDNRTWAARFARDVRVLDGYAFAGGFAVQAALAGASEVVAVDRSEGALQLAARAAEANDVAGRCRFVKAEVFQELQRQADAGERYGLVIRSEEHTSELQALMRTSYA